MLENIILTGGNTRIPGFLERLQKGLNENTDCFIEPHITHLPDPLCVYQALDDLSSSDEFEQMAFTRKTYTENGSDYMASLF